MRHFLRASSAEVLKLKRTLALWLSCLTPLLIVLLQFAFVLRIPERILKNGIWRLLENGLVMWPIFLFPLLACLLTALLNGVEHRENNWKQLFAAPVPRWTVYAAKAVAAHILMGIGTLTLWLGTIAVGYGLHALRPAAPFGPAPWFDLLRRLAMMYAAGSALLMIHLWIASRVKTFALPLGSGVVAVLVSLIAARDSLMKFWPWMFPFNITLPDRWMAALLLGACGGVVIGAFGALEISRRDIL